MDDEIEDIVGDVKYTDSQKSVATVSSVAYSLDFTDAGDRCSEKNLSSGKQTYVIECDSDSDNMIPLRDCESKKIEPLYGPSDCHLTESSSPVSSAKCGPSFFALTKYASTSYHYPLCSADAQESFTQTSKTIIELAETERVNNVVDSKNLQTQTSYMSFTENRTVEYRIQLTNYPMQDQITVDQLFIENYATSNISDHIQEPLQSIAYDETSVDEPDETVNPKDLLAPCFGKHQISFEFENESSNFPISETDIDNEEVVIRTFSNPSITSVESLEPVLKVADNEQATKSHEGIEDEENENQFCKEVCDDDSDHTPSDIEEDSLMRDLPSKPEDVKESGDNKIEVEESPRLLTPVTEETARKLSCSDVRLAETLDNIVPIINDELLFTNETGLKVKFLKPEKDDAFRLPPIHKSCPTSPHMYQLGNPKFNKSGTLPSLHENQNRWELSTKTLASGESPEIRGRSETRTRRSQPKFQLPPINSMSPERKIRLPEVLSSVTLTEGSQREPSISIKEKIRELKMTRPPWSIKRSSTRSHSENQSPSSSPERVEIATIANLGSEAMCVELLKRLREGSWYQVVETLEELPSALEKFWKNISEMRIADLLRQVNIHVESPRPQVARTACTAVAAILKNTNYTKKPDFYETISLLLIKTGSYSRLVRRSANLALDNIVCAVDLTHAITALCMHGVEHKNALVRCAAARLLVVSCALGGAGRKLLRARPPTAAAARRHTLRALAVLLDDKSTETRKYAERLYVMLRQLSTFEAYYLTDVPVDTATRQMKKYDLLHPPKDARFSESVPKP